MAAIELTMRLSEQKATADPVQEPTGAKGSIMALFSLWEVQHARASVADDRQLEEVLNGEKRIAAQILRTPARSLPDFAAKIAVLTDRGVDGAGLTGSLGEQVIAEALSILGAHERREFA